MNPLAVPKTLTTDTAHHAQATPKRIGCAEQTQSRLRNGYTSAMESATAALHRGPDAKTRLGGFNDIDAKNIFPTRKRLRTNADTRSVATRGRSFGGPCLRTHHEFGPCPHRIPYGPGRLCARLMNSRERDCLCRRCAGTLVPTHNRSHACLCRLGETCSCQYRYRSSRLCGCQRVPSWDCSLRLEWPYGLCSEAWPVHPISRHSRPQHPSEAYCAGTVLR
jgi:hypothetical protein